MTKEPTKRCVSATNPANINEAQSFDKGKQKVNDTIFQYNFDKANVDLCYYLVDNYQNTSSTCHQLPNELMALIVNLLSNEQSTLYECTLVSKSLHAIANPLLWEAPGFNRRRTSVKRFLARLSDTLPQQLATLARHIRKLEVDKDLWTETDFLHLVPHLSGLTHLTITSHGNARTPPITYEGPQPPFMELQVTLIDTHPDLSDVSFAAIAHHCRHLTTFVWHHSDPLSSPLLGSLSLCPLQHLDIKSGYISVRGMELIKRNFRYLTWLKLEQTNHHLAPTKYLHHSSSSRSSSRRTLWPHVVHLSLHPCNSIYDTSLTAFVISHPHLMQLDLMVARHLTDLSLDTMAQCLLKLTRLTLTVNAQITPNGVRKLIRQCRGLVYANFSHCCRLKADAFPELSVSGSDGFSQEWNRQALDKIRQGVTE